MEKEENEENKKVDLNRLKERCAKKETVDTDILLTSRNGDWKTMQPIRITNGHINEEVQPS